MEGEDRLFEETQVDMQCNLDLPPSRTYLDSRDDRIIVYQSVSETPINQSEDEDEQGTSSDTYFLCAHEMRAIRLLPWIVTASPRLF